MNAEIPKRPLYNAPEPAPCRELLAHEHEVARVAIEALREIMDQRRNNAAWLRGRAGRAIVKIVDSGWTP